MGAERREISVSCTAQTGEEMNRGNGEVL